MILSGFLSVYTLPHFQAKRKGEKWRRRWVSGFKALCRRISKFSEFGIISDHLSLELILKLVIHFITFTHFKQRKSRMENVNHHNPDEI